MANYMEELAQWRVQRQQREAADRVSQLSQEYQEATREGDRAIANNEIEEAEYQDNVCMDLEKDYIKICPPQPQMDPAAAQWVRENKAFFDRHGPNADAAVRAAHAWLTRPGNAGWKVNSPEYFKAVESLLETDGPSRYGVRYDPNEKELNPGEAAKVSGVSAKTYNNASRQLAAQGRFSYYRNRG
jgi:hypothetical protein